jgi:hypothetical protein
MIRVGIFLGLLTLLLAGLLISFPWIISFIEGWGSTYYNTSTVADFNGDGLLDVVVAHARYESESAIWAHTTLWTNQGNGKFTPTLLAYRSAVTAGDVDGDGDPDLVAVDQSQLQVMLNQGGRQGGEMGDFKWYGNPIVPPGDHGTVGSILLGDLDGDGDLDGFVAGCCSMLMEGGNDRQLYIPSHAWTWLNDWQEDGWLRRQTLSLKDLGDVRMRAAALGDLDGDGSLDVFAAVLAPRLGTESGHPDLVLLNDGLGNLRDSGQRLGAANSTAVALGDLDGDGDLDALVGASNGVMLWINQGGAQGGQQGQFELGEQTIAGGQVQHIFLADLDEDGDLDALVGGKSQAAIWWNDGGGSFTRANQPILRFTQRHGLALADFDGDGLPDIFAGAYNDSYSLWLNRGQGDFRKMP